MTTERRAPNLEVWDTFCFSVGLVVFRSVSACNSSNWLSPWYTTILFACIQALSGTLPKNCTWYSLTPFRNHGSKILETYILSKPIELVTEMPYMTFPKFPDLQSGGVYTSCEIQSQSADLRQSELTGFTENCVAFDGKIFFRFNSLIS